MAVLALLSAVSHTTVEQFLNWPYGPAGIAGLLLLAFGLRCGNTTCGCAGAVVLALLLTASGH